jgi:metal-responsive CopG/Arc/MetJ family transcriptional regulator
MTKRRITISVDAELVEAANEAVEQGRADSVSAWVSDALADKAAKESKLRALGEAIATYEAEFGVITEAEITEQQRLDREAAAEVKEEVRRRLGRRS